jgi:hypothetical protein
LITDPWLSTYIRAYHPACPLCARPLSDDADHCRHCGSELRLGLKPASRLYRLSWGIALGSSAFSAGCGLFLILLLLRRPMNLHRGTEVYQWTLLANCALGIFQTLAGAAFLVARRRFCRLPGEVRWIVAILCLAVFIGGVASLALVLT